MQPKDKKRRNIAVRKFSSFEEAEQAEDRWYASLTSQERLDIMFQLIDDYFKLMNLPDPGLVVAMRKGTIEELKNG